MTRYIIYVMLVGLALFAYGCSKKPQGYNTPEEAVTAIVGAARAGDTEKLKNILGKDSEDILNSGDPVADRNAVEKFVSLYDEKHGFETEADGSQTLVVGNNDWPMPIPLVKEGKVWRFDIERGRDEIVNRRIGQNELDVVEILLAIEDAQREYAVIDPENVGQPVYAEKLLSDADRKNGLFWQTEEGQNPSPLGPLVADASEAGYSRPDAGEAMPFHGYYFRLLKAQGENAAGGKREYVINGKLVGGFAAVAYPAEYGESGIMTFIVNHDGVVYERDLGEDSAKTAQAMTEFDPGPEWKKAETPVATPEAKK